MKHIKVVHKGNLCDKKAIFSRGCGECQASCQSACKTSCTVANQVCQKENE
ncbi:MAG: six-cysteine ranthipeptide SCIFF [Thermosediminibacteraceae bacterium]|nr:six-cysteine ranthipeptide SCIFF [Thermosediminibacteraceae bacterium]